MYVKVGEYSREKINYLRLVDTYACKAIEVAVISRRKYNIINEYLDMSNVTSGVMVVGLTSAARVAVTDVEEAVNCMLFYIETNKFEQVEIQRLKKMSEFLNIVYGVEQYAADAKVVTHTEHKRIEQMYATFLPHCQGSMSRASMLRRMDRAFLSTGYEPLNFGGRSYALCADGEGILRLMWLEDVKISGVSPFVIVKGTEELTIDKQTASTWVADMNNIDMSETHRLYVPDFITRTANISSGSNLCIGVRGVLYDTKNNATIGIDDLWGTVTCQ